jgi:nucleotide-binding universal stress UspA family protein
MRSILLHIADDDGLDTRIEAAIILARAFGGHITCLHMTPLNELVAADPLYMTVLPADFTAEMERLRLGLKKRVEAILEAENIAWNWRHRDEPTADGIIRQSVLSDVIVLSLAGAGAAPYASSLIGLVATNARAPILAIPRNGPTLDVNGVAAIAWDGSNEASMALRSSLPLLERAASVHLIEVSERSSHAGVDDGATYLSRHGIDARISHRLAGGDVGHAIIEAADKIDATLIVMGAYGHSRLNEYLFGGVTRTMLASSRVPLLLAH